MTTDQEAQKPKRKPGRPRNATPSEIAEALEIDEWSLIALRSRGMPIGSVEEAVKWVTENAPQGTPLQNARLRKERAAAGMAELKEKELKGELLRKDFVRSEVSRKATALKDAILQIPARLAPTLAAEGDVGTIERAIDRELRAALSHSADSL